MFVPNINAFSKRLILAFGNSPLGSYAPLAKDLKTLRLHSHRTVARLFSLKLTIWLAHPWLTYINIRQPYMRTAGCSIVCAPQAHALSSIVTPFLHPLVAILTNLLNKVCCGRQNRKPPKPHEST